MKNKIFLLSLLLAAMLCSSCATLWGPHVSAGDKVVVAAAVAAPAVASQAISASQAPASADYLIGPDDVLHVTVEQHPEWSGEFIVHPDGTILMQSLSSPTLNGLSRLGSEIALTTYLNTLIRNPRVSVDIVRYASQYIYVLGEVGRPGKYLTAGKELTLRDAVVLAGLPGHYAAIHRVYVITPSKDRKSVSQKVIDLDRVLNRGELTRDVRLNAGDIVYVPQTFWGHIATLISDLMSPVSSIPVARSAIAGVP